MHHAFKLGDSERNVELSRAPDGYRLHLGERTLAVRWDGTRLQVDGAASEVLIATRGDDVFVHVDGEVHHLRYEHPLERLAHQAQGGADDVVRAPMPGSIVAVSVKPGQAVKRGETLLVMESMKMETTIAAPRDATVEAVSYTQGQTFDRDAVLLKLEPPK